MSPPSHCAPCHTLWNHLLTWTTFQSSTLFGVCCFTRKKDGGFVNILSCNLWQHLETERTCLQARKVRCKQPAHVPTIAKWQVHILNASYMSPNGGFYVYNSLDGGHRSRYPCHRTHLGKTESKQNERMTRETAHQKTSGKHSKVN